MTKVEFKKVRESFFDTIFVLLGRIANCDGYVNRDELKRTKTYMERMKLSDYCKKQAIRLFRTGASPSFNIADRLEEFKHATMKSPQVIEVLLVYLISVARVDGLLVDKEIKMIRQVASALGYSSIMFEHILRMVTAQDNFYKSANNRSESNSGQKKSTDVDHKLRSLKINESAYQALGIPVTADKADVKKAYRKLINQYHPDKIQGQGLPPEFINAANDYFKRIQIAYEYIESRTQ